MLKQKQLGQALFGYILAVAMDSFVEKGAGYLDRQISTGAPPLGCARLNRIDGMKPMLYAQPHQERLARLAQ